MPPKHAPTVAGAAGSTGRAKGRKQQQMPLCTYGLACTRRDCVYRHPPKPKPQAQPPQEELRIDPSDGQAYPLSSFLEVYGGTPQRCAQWEAAQPLRRGPPPNAPPPAKSSWAAAAGGGGGGAAAAKAA